MFLDALTPRAIELAVAEWARDCARSTVNSWPRVLRTTLNDAVAQGVISSNPAARVRALRERSDDDGDEDDWANALTPVELDAYLRAWKALYTVHVPLITTLVLTVLRWGEATALTWADVDAAEQLGVLRVRRSHVRGAMRKHGQDRQAPHRALPGRARDRARRSPVVLKQTEITKHVTIHRLRRTATDLLRHAAVDPVAAKAIIGHTTDRMREHYSTIGTDEASGIGARLCPSSLRSAQREMVDQLVDPPHSRSCRVCRDTCNTRKLLIFS